MEDLGMKLFERRQALGLTLEEVGKAVGVGKSTVRKWEKGMIKNMGRDKIAKLANVLQMSPVELVPAVSTVGIKSSSETLSSSETRLITLYRGADDRAQRDAVRILEENQKQDTASEQMA